MSFCLKGPSRRLKSIICDEIFTLLKRRKPPDAETEEWCEISTGVKTIKKGIQSVSGTGSSLCSPDSGLGRGTGDRGRRGARRQLFLTGSHLGGRSSSMFSKADRVKPRLAKVFALKEGSLSRSSAKTSKRYVTASSKGKMTTLINLCPHLESRIIPGAIWRVNTSLFLNL